MRNFSRDNNSRGRDRDNRGGRGGEDRQMHKTTCSDCGRPCEVPFKPSGDKPVFCSSCFKKDDSPRNEDRSYDRREDRGRDRDRVGDRDRGKLTMHRATCAECGKPCEVPFKPSGDKPVFCSNCFGKGNGGPSPSKPDQSGRKFDEMNAKLDQILSILKEQPVKEVSGIKLKKLGMAPVKTVPVAQTAPAAPKKEAKKVAPKKEDAPKKPAKKASKKKAK